MNEALSPQLEFRDVLPNLKDRLVLRAMRLALGIRSAHNNLLNGVVGIPPETDHGQRQLIGLVLKRANPSTSAGWNWVYNRRREGNNE